MGRGIFICLNVAERGICMDIPGSYYELVKVLGALYEEVDGCSFYEYLFPDNERQGEARDDYFYPNAVYLYQANREQESYKDRKMRRRIMLSDTWETDYCEYIEGNQLSLCSGLAYRGRYNRLQNAQRMYALIFDLDGVGEHEFRILQYRLGMAPMYASSMPMPTFLVASGAGLHVYYVFQEPIDLYPNIKLQLKALKYALTQRLWDYNYTSTVKEPQYQSINQTFRMVGSINGKYGNVIRAYQTGDRVTLDELNQYVKADSRVDVNRPFKPSRMTREQAKEAYPEWYQRVVVEKKRRLKKWDIKSKQGYALYNWWLNRVGEVQGGHRYYYLMCMVIYACKCDVPRNKLVVDMNTAYEYLKTIAHDNPLTREDIKSALETYDKEYYNFTIDDIVKLSGLHIEKSKRNGRKQTVHLERARAVQKIDYPNGEWRDGNGRPSAEPTIRKFMQRHPDARKIDVIEGTGKSAKTVYKYYDRIKEEQFGIKPGTENKIRAFMEQNPTARKADVIRGTGLSKPTVYKYYDKVRQEIQPEND